MTPGGFDPGSLALLPPAEARGFAEKIARALGFNIASGRSGDGCYVLEGARGAGSRAEKAIFLVALEWPVDLPKIDERRGILMNFAGADVRARGWEVVGQEDIVKMAEALGVALPEETGRREPRRPSADPKFLPSVDKLESDMRWGSDFLSEGKYAEAIGYFDRVIDSKPGYTEALRLKGKALAESGDLAGAERTLRSAIESSPEDSSLWLGLAEVFQRRRKPREELACLVKTLELNPSSADAWLRRGEALSKPKTLDEAALCFIKADKFSGGSARALAGLGSVLAKRGDWEGAEEAYRKALALDASCEEARVGLAELKPAAESEAKAVKKAPATGEDAEEMRLTPVEKAKPAKAGPSKPATAPVQEKTDDEPHSDIDYYWNKIKGGKEAVESEPAEDEEAEQAVAKPSPSPPPKKEPVRPASKSEAPSPAEKAPEQKMREPSRQPAKAEVSKPAERMPEKIILEPAKRATEKAPPGEDAPAKQEKGREQGLLDELLRAELGMAKGKKQARKELSALKIEPPEPAEKTSEPSEAERLAKLREEFICFGDYDKDDPDCKECDVENECVLDSDDADLSDEYICFGECDECEDDCKNCPVKDKCMKRKKEDGEGSA